jgi:hypothetical protein
MAIFSVRASGPLEHMLRLAGLLAVVGLVVAGFWRNSERNMERLNARVGLSDETRSLSVAEQEHIQAVITALRASYGLEARVQIRQGEVDPPKQDGKTVFVGLSLRAKSAVIVLPPLVERALGPDFAQKLMAEHFPFHFGPGKSWQKGLILALDLMEARLAALKAPANGTQKDTP